MWLLLPLPFRGHEATDEAEDTWGRKLSEGVLEAGAEGGPPVERGLWARGLQWLNRPRCLGCQWGGPAPRAPVLVSPAFEGQGPSYQPPPGHPVRADMLVFKILCLAPTGCPGVSPPPPHLTCQEG